ncbi:hypothetical protein [Novosphingobium sp.]|nr:hypothetical protein [Novosphingobium sp.]HKR91495.1 hypothetical protein [Novosphingobium sp.]
MRRGASPRLICIRFGSDQRHVFGAAMRRFFGQARALAAQLA